MSGHSCKIEHMHTAAPGLARAVLTLKEARVELIEHSARLAVNGVIYRIKCKSLGAGMRELTLVPQKPWITDEEREKWAHAWTIA